VVLLEVVAALALFSAAAVVVLSAMGASVRAADGARLQAVAADLAVTRLSEIQMGLEPVQSDGPTEYEDAALAGWTWEVAVSDADTPADLPAMQFVEVIIRHAGKDLTYRLVDVLPAQREEGAALVMAKPGREGRP
jgi:type II secretion system protein I